MAPWANCLGAAAAAGLLLARLAPEYLLLKSQWLTILVLYSVLYTGYGAWSVLIYPHFFSPLRNLPQPKGNSIFMGQFARILKEPSGQPQNEWCETIPNDGLIYYRFAFNASRVIPTTPKGLAEVMTQKSYDFVKPKQVRVGLGRLLGIGVLLAEGDEHKRQRRSLNPAFAFRHVKEIYPVFWSKSRDMVLAMDKATSNKEAPTNVVDVGHWASRATLDIIGVAGFDQSFNATEDESSELYQTYQKVFRFDRNARVLGIMNLLLPNWIVRNLPIESNLRIIRAAELIRKVCLDMIHQKKQKMEKGIATGVDILSVALQSGSFDDEDLVNQLMTFLAAGHETTASAMQWAIALICQNPEVQTKLRKILFESKLPDIRDANGKVAAEDIDSIPYLNAVCSEVLRYMPPVPFTLRQAAKDTSIQGQFIPKGTTVILAPQAINRNKALWGEDADKFNPERWMKPGCANSGGADSNYAFLTFLHGPRSCIGMSFARSEFAILLAAWVMAFDTQLDDPKREIEVQGGVTQRPKGGLPVKITPTAR